ncbi:hypothetical protein HAX54_017224 [Datura stramonium]|uniref:Uncharacterized protein n=1 Tax=Datura stramonium TaxID=4076 RepID=A0ABS8UML0_DATST|nr:hypothetical protein [Datura stramonium]
MDFFKMKKFRKAHKPEPETDIEDKPVPLPGEQKNENDGQERLAIIRNLLKSRTQMITPVHQIQCSLEKKKVKLKELRKRTKNLKKKSWPSMPGDVDLLLGLIDVKVMNRISQDTANRVLACLANTIGAAESVLRVSAKGHDKRLFLKVVVTLYVLSVLGRVASSVTIAYAGLCFFCLYMLVDNSQLINTCLSSHPKRTQKQLRATRGVCSIRGAYEFPDCSEPKEVMKL